MAVSGASRPLWRAPASVSFLNPEPALGLVGGNPSSCPFPDLARSNLWGRRKAESDVSAQCEIEARKLAVGQRQLRRDPVHRGFAEAAAVGSLRL